MIYDFFQTEIKKILIKTKQRFEFLLKVEFDYRLV
jgi:hypothetical protein